MTEVQARFSPEEHEEIIATLMGDPLIMRITTAMPVDFPLDRLFSPDHSQAHGPAADRLNFVYELGLIQDKRPIRPLPHGAVMEAIHRLATELGIIA